MGKDNSLKLILILALCLFIAWYFNLLAFLSFNYDILRGLIPQLPSI